MNSLQTPTLLAEDSFQERNPMYQNIINNQSPELFRGLSILENLPSQSPFLNQQDSIFSKDPMIPSFGSFGLGLGLQRNPSLISQKSMNNDDNDQLRLSTNNVSGSSGNLLKPQTKKGGFISATSSTQTFNGGNFLISGSDLQKLTQGFDTDSKKTVKMSAQNLQLLHQSIIKADNMDLLKYEDTDLMQIPLILDRT